MSTAYRLRFAFAITTAGVVLSLAGCSGLFHTAEREPWRRDAEVSCLNSGTVHEGVTLTRMDPINGPGVCGADFPLKVEALGETDANSGLGFADDPRPPGSVGYGNQPNWPISQQSSAPMSRDSGDSYSPQLPAYSPALPAQSPTFGPVSQPQVAAIGPVAVKPAATLACPIVSVLDHWISESVQPAALKWFGQPVVEIKQISAYSCRGMNGDPNAHISEHAFGNAMDVAAFTLADGRKIVVETGWHGAPEEQGFLRDVQGAACQQFTTVLAPGSNKYHYNHIHVDLMRRATRRIICEPAAVSGDEIAARMGYRGPSFANQRPDQLYTGSLGGPSKHASK
jgi:hypothetical protein